MRRLAAALALVLVGYAYGIASYRLDIFPIPRLRAWHDRLFEDIGFRDAAGRQEVACAGAGRTAIIIAFGQSNSANHGETRGHSSDRVTNFNFFDGKCYRAEDPLLGATGDGGSVWTRLGDILVGRDMYDSVVLAPIGVGGSPISDWVPGGRLFERLEGAVHGLKRQGLKPTHLLWENGAADALKGTSGAAYEASFANLKEGIRRLKIDAPIYVSIATVCRNFGSEEIRNAQRDIIESSADVRRGADTDNMAPPEWRFDGCHFSALGLTRVAEIWADAIAP